MRVKESFLERKHYWRSTILVILLFAFSCSEDELGDVGAIVFYTNSATAGGSYIDVYVNDKLIGQVTEYISGTVNCESPGAIGITYEVGKKFQYKGVGEDGTTWSGSFKIPSVDECALIGFN